MNTEYMGVRIEFPDTLVVDPPRFFSEPDEPAIATPGSATSYRLTIPQRRDCRYIWRFVGCWLMLTAPDYDLGIRWSWHWHFVYS